MDEATERIRQAVKRNPKERLTALLHHVSVDALRVAYLGLGGDAAAGVDGMTWTDYADGRDERLLDLHRRVQAGAYRAPAARRVYIPEPDGGTRPLGIAALEDKIVQKAVVDGILTPIYEAEFLGFSYGFRPGRGAHDALDAPACERGSGRSCVAGGTEALRRTVHGSGESSMAGSTTSLCRGPHGSRAASPRD